MRLLMLFAVAMFLGCGVKSPPPPPPPPAPDPKPVSLVGTEWLLEDLGGAGVVDRVQSTLAFLPEGRVGGSSGCNRMMGGVTIAGSSMTFSKLGGTMMACPPAVMDQERKYLDALSRAKSFRMDGAYLLIESEGLAKPLKFTRKTP